MIDFTYNELVDVLAEDSLLAIEAFEEDVINRGAKILNYLFPLTVWFLGEQKNGRFKPQH